MDNLPTWDITQLTPSFIDGMQYAAGEHTDPAGWTGAFNTWAAPLLLPESTYGGSHDFGAPLQVYVAAQPYLSSAWSINQWAAYQTVVPLDDAPGSMIGVRCSSGNGYFLHNVSYTEDGSWWFTLYRLNNGNMVTLRQWGGPWGNPDGAFVILEVCGTNPVKLRASWALSPWGQYPNPYHISREGPHDFPADASSPILLGTYDDSSAGRILTGVPGFGYGFGNTAGGCYGFNAGEFKELTPSKLTVASTIDTITMIFGGGAFIVDKIFGASTIENLSLVQPPGLARTLAGEATLIRLDGSVPEIYTLGGSRWN